MISKLPGGGVGRLFSLKWYSSKAAVAQPQKHILQDYLVDSLGFSEEEALSTTQKVSHRKFSRNPPDSVVNFLRNLGLNKIQIKNIVKLAPVVLSYDVQKTLLPKIQTLQDIGISGLDLVKIMENYKTLLVRQVGRPVEYLRNLLGSDENAAQAIKSYNLLLLTEAPRIIAPNVMLLGKYGLSKKHVSALILRHPSAFFRKPELLEEGIQRVENDFKISRESKMFYQAVKVVLSVTKSTADRKLEILRSFGWSDATIYSMVRRFPSILVISEGKIRKVLNFTINELGCTLDYLAIYPVLFGLNFEKRLKPRSEVLKILDAKKLNKRKTGFYNVLCLTESRFVNKYLLPYKNEIPDVFDSYFKVVGGREKMEIL